METKIAREEIEGRAEGEAFQRVALIGLGLMGGSLGLALKTRGFPGTVTAYARREATREEALRRAVVDEVFASPEEAVHAADLVVFCLPILTIPELVKRCAPALRPGCLLTDVGSTKERLARDLPALLEGTSAAFMGSHPIAGSERQGLEAARADLYTGATVVVTPAAGDPPQRVEPLRRFWEGVGSHVLFMDPAAHDRILARTSHLPHMVAALLVATVARGEDLDRVRACCGTGFRDTTRIAGGSPDIWRDIAETNSKSLVEELLALRAGLDDMVAWLSREDRGRLKAFLEDCRARRQILTGEGKNSG
jgi:prephenate dehydrogenase